MSDLVEQLRAAYREPAIYGFDSLFVEAADALKQAEEKIALLTRTVEALGKERLTQMETSRP